MTTQSSDDARGKPAGLGPGGHYARWGKRAFDIAAASVALVLTAPLMAVLAAAVAATLGRPVLFRQVRVGRGGVEFVCIKFRTMRPDRRARDRGALEGGSERRVTHKSADDPRLTGLGRLMRRASLDELPQLFNVLRGEMSLVGPRPELPAIVARYEPWQHRRHAVKPGLTGLWQVSARGDVEMHEATAVDLEYVDRLGLATDLSILGRTIPALITRPGK